MQTRPRPAHAATAALIAAACLCLAAYAAASRPDFTGTWELDQSRSHSIPPDMKQTMTVVHDGDALTVETKITNAQGERVVKDAYRLDGRETAFDPPRPPNAPTDAPAPKGKRAGRWMSNDRGFIVEEEIVSATPQGPETILVARKWMSWPDGTLSIEVITERGGNAFNNKRVFVKK
jgi:hypothetical protein